MRGSIPRQRTSINLMKGGIMLNTIISVLIANLISLVIWMAVLGFINAIELQKWQQEKAEQAKVEKRPFQTCGDPECECSNMDCD